MNDWSWWHALSMDERIALAEAQRGAREGENAVQQNVDEARRIYAMGRARAGGRQ